MRFLLILLAAFSGLFGNASAQSFTSCPGGAKVLYVNGILTANAKVAASSADLLATRIADFNISCVGDVAFHYNPSEKIARDLLQESALQKATELGISLGDAVLSTLLVWSGQPAPLFPEAVQQAVRNQIVPIIEKVSLSTYSFQVDGITKTTADVVKEIRDKVSAGLDPSAAVVLVGHSQGNFFVNEAYKAVRKIRAPSDVDRLAVVNVSNVSIEIPSNLYISSNQDWVIQALRLLRAAPEANFPVGDNAEDSLGHGIDTTYLRRDLPSNLGPRFSVAAKVMDLLQAALNKVGSGKPNSPAIVLYTQPGTNEAIQLSPPSSFRYYFLGYQTAGNPPTQANYWTATQSFDVVRIRLLGGTGTCSDLGPAIASSSRLVDETGQTVATLVADTVASGAGYCVFRTNVSAGARIAAVELSPGLLSTKTFTLAGSSQNSGRSLYSFAAERAGGFAFQFCAGLCDQPLGTPGGTAPIVSAASCTAPIVGQAMTCTVVGTNLPTTISFTASNCSPSPMTVVAGGTGVQRQFTCTPVTAGVLVQVSYIVPEFIGPLPPVAATVATLPPPPPPPSAQLNDTGIRNTQCFGTAGVGLVPCDSADALAFYAYQDGMSGRDVTTPNPSDGVVGFSFSTVAIAGGGSYPLTDCVRDNVTGLTWEGKTRDGGPRDYRRDVIGSDDAIAAYVREVNDAALCGRTDWRLPSSWELLGIGDFGATGFGTYSLDTAWFVNPNDSWIWSETPIAPGARRYVNFTGGSPFASWLPKTWTGSVMLVAGASPTRPEPRFVLSADGSEVEDNATGLVWSQFNFGFTCTYEDAIAEAKRFTSASGKPWRLPTAKEAFNLLELDTNLSLHTNALFNSAWGNFWTSTPYLGPVPIPILPGARGYVHYIQLDSLFGRAINEDLCGFGFRINTALVRNR